MAVARCALAEYVVDAVALYGVRVSRMGARFAPFGTRMTVCSFTPSRMGIMTSRRTWSKPTKVGVSFAGVSLGSVVTWALSVTLAGVAIRKPKAKATAWRATGNGMKAPGPRR